MEVSFFVPLFPFKTVWISFEMDIWGIQAIIVFSLLFLFQISVEPSRQLLTVFSNFILVHEKFMGNSMCK